MQNTLEGKPVPVTTALKPGTPEPPPSAYGWGDALLDLTDRLNESTSGEAAELLDQILAPTHGLLERLGDFFEAAGEKAKESEQDDGFDLRDEFDNAAAEIRRLTEDLHVAGDRMRALTPPSQPHRSRVSPPHTRIPLTPRPMPPPLPGPRHTR
ncbi:hypothetical protein GCM10009654_15240 [Streptomyces hebeiensis]|uniref:Uncharacterized protein n=1 Tax=Streptomyces hebeiensis TaxID=229486 RepID=A0ABN1UN68_9ACTN